MSIWSWVGWTFPPPSGLRQNVKWQQQPGGNKFLWVDWETSRHTVIRSQERKWHRLVDEEWAKELWTGVMTFKIFVVRKIFESESNWKLWHLPFLHWNKIYGSRIRKPNPLHFVFLIWIKFYDTIKCPEYYIWTPGVLYRRITASYGDTQEEVSKWREYWETPRGPL